jgi:hypothetical protein
MCVTIVQLVMHMSLPKAAPTSCQTVEVCYLLGSNDECSHINKS